MPAPERSGAGFFFTGPRLKQNKRVNTKGKETFMSANVRMRFGNDERISPNVSPFVRAFLCCGHGVLLLPSYYTKKTIQFARIMEDDGYWFEASDEIGGVADLRSLMCAMNAAYDWCLRKTIMDEETGEFSFKPGTQCVGQKHRHNNRGSVWVPVYK